MLPMLLAGGLFLGTHLGISSTGLRAKLVKLLGQGGYLALYSVLALGTLAYLIWLYTELPRYDYFWLPNPTLYLIAKLIMPVAFVLFVGGFMVKNPTNVGAESILQGVTAETEFARGVTRITRHPFQWSVMLWSSCHLLANGDSVSVGFFSTFLVLSVAGSMLLDRKKAASLGADWAVYQAQTSNVPFAAILRGKNRLVAKELILPVVVGGVLYAAVLWGHEWVGGVRIL